MANGKIAKTHPDAAHAAEYEYDLEQKRREEESFNRLFRAVVITKWIAIVWVSIYFVLACLFIYYLLTTFLPLL